MRHISYDFRFLNLTDEEFAYFKRCFGDLAEYSSGHRVVCLRLSSRDESLLKRKVIEAIGKFPDVRHDFFFGITTTYVQGKITPPRHVMRFVQRFGGEVNFSFIVI